MYAVRVEPTEEDWRRAGVTLDGLLRELAKKDIDNMSGAKLYDVLTRMMKAALQRHHQWLSERQIKAVVAPDEPRPGLFLFYFERDEDARAFEREFAHHQLA